MGCLQFGEIETYEHLHFIETLSPSFPAGIPHFDHLVEGLVVVYHSDHYGMDIYPTTDHCLDPFGYR